MVTLSSADNALKSYYLEAVTNTLDEKVSPFFSKIEKTSVNVTGKDVKKVVRTGINNGVGAGTETGDLPTADEGQYLTLTSTLKNIYGTIEISDKAIRASANNEGAFVNLLNDELNSLAQSAKYQFSRMLFGDGSNLLCYSDDNGNDWLRVDSVVGMTEGMKVQVFAMGGEVIPTIDYLTISKIDRSQRRVYFKEGAVFNGISMVGGQLYAGKKTDLELTGLRAIFSTNKETLYGQSKDNAFMRPYSISGQSPDESTMQRMIDTLEENEGSTVDLMLCSYAVRRKILATFSEKGIELPTVEMEGGFKAISYKGIPIVADRFCPENTLYFLNTKDFKLHQLCDWQWLEAEDGKILKQVPGKPVYTATLVKYAELICERPCAQGVMEIFE